MTGYEIKEGAEHTQFDRVHAWLESTYWSPGIEREKVERAASFSSLVINVFHGEEQVAYARIVSDRTRFAWLCDVFVDEAHRGKGIAKAMVRYALDHPEHQGLRRWLLATRDAHDVYAACGFEPLPNPERWMVRQQD